MAEPGFFVVDDSGALTDAPARFVLVRVDRAHSDDRGNYRLEERFGYRDERGREFVVPVDLETFTTDLASIPLLAAWLVPRDGRHAPAAILHDALVQGDTSPAVEDREVADAIFRDAMRLLGVRFLRRWMMWAAVSLLTMWKTATTSARRIRAGVLSGVCIALLGIGFCSVWDLFDVALFSVLPWLDDRGLGAELVNGAVAAAVCAAVVPLLFWPRPRVGFVAAMALIPLAFPLAGVAVAFGLYTAAEWLAGKVAPTNRRQ
jgi:hypothetical protein